MLILDNILALLLAAVVLVALVALSYKWLLQRFRFWRTLARIKTGQLTAQDFPPTMLDTLSSKDRATLLAHLEARLAALPGQQPLADHQQVYSAPSDWLVAVFQARHLLITGAPRSGLLTFTHLLATTRAATTARVIVCTPTTAPGRWSGCEVYSSPQQAECERLVRDLRQELAARAKLHQDRGKQSFSVIHLVVTDYANVVQRCPDLRLLVKEVLTSREALDCHLILSLFPKDAAALELHPQNPTRSRFTYILEVQHDGRQRWIRMIEGASEQLIGIYPMPQLEPVDPDETVTLSA